MRPKSVAPRIERSTCVSAAKLTIASHPRAAAVDVLGIRDVALVELAVHALEVRPVVRRVRELVEHDDLVAGREQAPDEVGADEPAAAGDQHAHRREG